ncbi:MAG: LacI family DNA-binding transcriptional regulator [Pseudomonadota bacterium]
MSTRVTSLQVAERAGVSQSAVSRVFTKGASASSATEAKVRKAAEELGYSPNILARSIKTGRSRIIGLVVAYLDNYFYPEALEKLSKVLQERGYHVLIFMAGNTADNIDQVMQEILDYQVDGIIVASVALSSDLAQKCSDANVPVVMFNRKQNQANVGSVTSTNFAGGIKVANFLVAHNPKRIGYIAGWEGASTQRDREAGFVRQLAKHGREIDARLVGNFRRDETKEAARAMFDRPDRPDAVFVANDHMAFFVLDVLRGELGLQVPKDVMVVGYDDVPPAAWPAYDLTTIRQPANRMVAATVEMLLDTIEQGHPCTTDIEIDSPLIIRGTAPAPTGWNNT